MATVLARFGCQPHPSEFHNAGNDAVYTLFAMLLLAIKRADTRAAELNEGESTSLEAIRCAVSNPVDRGVSYNPFDRQHVDARTGRQFTS